MGLTNLEDGMTHVSPGFSNMYQGTRKLDSLELARSVDMLVC